MQLLRIFTYHNIGNPHPGAQLPRLYVAMEKFDRQCWLLHKLGMRGVAMTEGLRGLRTGNANKLVVLSFDDGYADNLLHGAPILSRYGFHATCYVVSGAIGGHNYWDSEQLGVEKPLMNRIAIEKWLEAGHEIGSHTVNHRHLTAIDHTQAQYEIFESRHQLQQFTGTPVDHFCYPWGENNDTVVEMVRAAGYSSAVTTKRGPAAPDSDLLRLPRISIDRGRGLFKFALHAATRYSWLRRH